MTSDWDSTRRWREILERRLNVLGSQVKGNQDFQADRVADLVEQIEELRKECQAEFGKLRQKLLDLSIKNEELEESLGKAREAYTKLAGKSD